MGKSVYDMVMWLFERNLDVKLRRLELINAIMELERETHEPNPRSAKAIDVELSRAFKVLVEDEKILSKISEHQNVRYFLTDYGKERILQDYERNKKMLWRIELMGTYKGGDSEDKFLDRAFQHLKNQYIDGLKEMYKEENKRYLASKDKQKQKEIQS
jgi:hypothetical protein